MINSQLNIIERTKELLAEQKHRIELDSFITSLLKDIINKTSSEQLPVKDKNGEKDNFLNRLQIYEEILKDFQKVVILLVRWGNNKQLLILEKVLKRLAEMEDISSGSSLWIRLRWFPIQVLMYYSGITALSVRNYFALKIILTTHAFLKISSITSEYHPIIIPVNMNIFNINEVFKCIPGHERTIVPISEYLFKILEPQLQETLFLGKEYEMLFDEFEIFNALVYADIAETKFWPIGRFGYKYRREGDDNAVNRLSAEAMKKGNSWAPLQLGMFDGSLDRFRDLMKELKNRIEKLAW